MSVLKTDSVFPRNFRDDCPLLQSADGVYLYDIAGKRYLDASGGAAVVSIGHGVTEVNEAMSRQAHEVAYAHSSQFHTQVEVELSQFLAGKFPGLPQAARVFFTSGGSEATETAIKIIRLYWLARNEPNRQKLVSRWHGYHGATMGALAISGNRKRRHHYLPFLTDACHIAPCFCYHRWLHKQYPDCELACARELDAAIQKLQASQTAAFFVEPVVGASSGAVPVEGYLEHIRATCDSFDVLLVADEIMTGAGRTGKYFAVEHWGVVPDIILLGKGLSSGYAPLGAVLIGEKVWSTIADSALSMEHGFTYQAHPISLAAGLAVQHYLEDRNLVQISRQRGKYLVSRLARLRGSRYVGDIRGMGLLQVVEFVQNQKTREPFAPDLKISKRIYAELRSRGVMVYPGSGTVDGQIGDHILIAPPFIIETSQIDWLVDQIREATSAVCDRLVLKKLPKG